CALPISSGLLPLAAQLLGLGADVGGEVVGGGVRLLAQVPDALDHVFRSPGTLNQCPLLLGQLRRVAALHADEPLCPARPCDAALPAAQFVQGGADGAAERVQRVCHRASFRWRRSFSVSARIASVRALTAAALRLYSAALRLNSAAPAQPLRADRACAAGVSSGLLPLAAQLLGLGADRLGPGLGFGGLAAVLGGLAAVLGGAVPVLAGRLPVAAGPLQVLHRHEVAAADLAGGVDGERQAGDGHGEGDERQGHDSSLGPPVMASQRALAHLASPSAVCRSKSSGSTPTARESVSEAHGSRSCGNGGSPGMPWR